MTDLEQTIADNLAQIRERIGAAAARVGRRGESVKLVAVTKYVGEAEIRALVRSGCVALGENRSPQLCQRAQAFRDLPIEWHMIGHLQRNKARPLVPVAAMIESVDSPRLLDALDRIAGELGVRVRVLLEVNVSGETQKHGLSPDELPSVVERLGDYGRVDVCGLMGMAALEGGPETARANFAELRRLRDRMRERFATGSSLVELSMGMSGDFEIAIEEGATLVRIGSALFERAEP